MPAPGEDEGPRPRFGRGSPFSRSGVLLAALLFVAALLRFRRLGALCAWIDEPLMWMATDAIHRLGAPWLPSGILYPRAPVHLFMTAAACLPAGIDEFTLRLPSVLFSLALIVLVYRFAADLFGRPAGWLTAAILTVSPWDIHYARMGRMYEMSAFLYALTVFLACRAFTRQDRRAHAGSLVAAALAVLTHRQGAALVLVFVIPLLFPSDLRPRRGSMARGVATCIAALGVLLVCGAWGYGRGPTIDTPHLYQRAIMLPLIGPVDLNDARWILLEAYRTTPLAGVIPLVVFTGAATWWAVLALRNRAGPLLVAACAGWAIALLFNQLVPAVVMILVGIKASCRDARCAIMRGGLMLAATAVWTTALLACAAWAWGWTPLLRREFLRVFFALPVPWYRLLAGQFSWMMLVVACGSAAILLRSLPPGRSQAQFFTAAAFWGPLLLMGVLAAPYRLHRYNYFLNGVFVVLFAGTVVRAAGWVAGRLRALPNGRRPGIRLATAAGLVVAVVLSVPAGQMDVRQAWRVGRRTYGDNRDLLGDPDLVSHFYYDLESPALYVAERLREDDLVIARDPVGLWPRLRTLHCVLRGTYYGQARAAEGRRVDLYLGIPLISDAATLRRVVERHQGASVWIIDSVSVPGGPDVNMPPDVTALLATWADREVYRARDGITRVLRIPRSMNGEP